MRGGATNAAEGRWNPRVTMGKVECRESKPEAGKAVNNGHMSLMKS